MYTHRSVRRGVVLLLAGRAGRTNELFEGGAVNISERAQVDTAFALLKFAQLRKERFAFGEDWLSIESDVVFAR